MLARDRHAAAVMRTVIAALENAEAVSASANATPIAMSEHVAGAAAGLGAGEAPRRVLTPEEERALVEREVADLRSTSATLAAAGRHDRSAELLHAAHTLEGILEG
jgi:hypothetical protein